MASFTVVLLSLLLLLLDSSSSFSTTPPQLLALNLKCIVKPTHRSKFLTAIQEHQQSTRKNEPNNLQFVIGQDVDDPNTFYFHEEFKSMAAFQDHLDSDHCKKYNEFVKTEEPYLEKPDMNMCFYHPAEEDDDALVTKRGVHKESFGLNVNLYPKASVRGEFLKVISDNKKGTDTIEELALQYTYGESISVDGISKGSSSANKFHFHEQYTGKDHGKEGFDVHASMPHFAAWEEFVKTDPFEKDPEVFFFKIIESE
jgi:quinol monooxygenase YgiN